MLSLMHLCCCWTVVTAYASVYWSAVWATELFCLRTTGWFAGDWFAPYLSSCCPSLSRTFGAGAFKAVVAGFLPTTTAPLLLLPLLPGSAGLAIGHLVFRSPSSCYLLV